MRAVQVARRPGRSTGRRSRVGMVDDADADLGDERAACSSDDVARARSTTGAAAAAAARRPPRDPAADCLRVDVVGVALEQHPRGRAVPQHARRPVHGRDEARRVGRSSVANHRDAAGTGRVRRITSPMQPERAERADEQRGTGRTH